MPPALQRLRDPHPGGPLDQLADLTASELLDQPWPGVEFDLAEALAAAARAAAESDDLPVELEALADRLVERLSTEERSLRELLGPEGVQLLRALGDSPWSPSPELVERLLDQEPVRKLLQELLGETLLRFARKLRDSATDGRVGRGLGGLGRLARSQVKARTGPLGSLAGGVVGAVSDEVERKLEHRVAEFIDGALAQVLSRLTQRLSGDEHSDDQRALRRAILEAVLDLRGDELAVELRSTDLGAQLVELRAPLRTLAADPDLVQRLASGADRAQELTASSTPGELLNRLGLRAEAQAVLAVGLRPRLSALVGSDRFEVWWRRLDEQPQALT